MRVIPLVLVLLAAIAAPGTLVAQEEADSPPTLRLSFFMCNTNRLGDAMDEVESQVIPVWNELVAEGMVESYGYFVHRWADEWNVGIYTVAENIEAVLAASQEAGRRIEERYPDNPNAFGEACPHHRDGFYAIGPSTSGDEEETDDNGG
jgi:hypothetical protein